MPRDRPCQRTLPKKEMYRLEIIAYRLTLLPEGPFRLAAFVDLYGSAVYHCSGSRRRWIGESVVCGGELVSAQLARLAAREGNTEIRYTDVWAHATREGDRKKRTTLEPLNNWKQEGRLSLFLYSRYYTQVSGHSYAMLINDNIR